MEATMEQATPTEGQQTFEKRQKAIALSRCINVQALTEKLASAGIGYATFFNGIDFLLKNSARERFQSYLNAAESIAYSEDVWNKSKDGIESLVHNCMNQIVCPSIDDVLSYIQNNALRGLKHDQSTRVKVVHRPADEDREYPSKMVGNRIAHRFKSAMITLIKSLLHIMLDNALAKYKTVHDMYNSDYLSELDANIIGQLSHCVISIGEEGIPYHIKGGLLVDTYPDPWLPEVAHNMHRALYKHRIIDIDEYKQMEAKYPSIVEVKQGDNDGDADDVADNDEDDGDEEERSNNGNANESTMSLSASKVVDVGGEGNDVGNLSDNGHSEKGDCKQARPQRKSSRGTSSNTVRTTVKHSQVQVEENDDDNTHNAPHCGMKEDNNPTKKSRRSSTSDTKLQENSTPFTVTSAAAPVAAPVAAPAAAPAAAPVSATTALTNDQVGVDFDVDATMIVGHHILNVNVPILNSGYDSIIRVFRTTTSLAWDHIQNHINSLPSNDTSVVYINAEMAGRYNEAFTYWADWFMDRVLANFAQIAHGGPDDEDDEDDQDLDEDDQDDQDLDDYDEGL